ncbi:hypothetical protein TNCV_2054401 [Trichonephila clavipes]|nr:hypothetical protein TNCV_2054401 [Trichonephila clavipes]
MSLGGMELYACCPFCVNTGRSVLSVDDAGVVVQQDLIRAQNLVGQEHHRLSYQTGVQICSQCFWGYHESTPAVIGNCSPDHDSRAEPAFTRRHNRSPFRSPMSSGLTPLASQIAMDFQSVEYTLLGALLEAFLEVRPISNSSLFHFSINCSSNFGLRHSTMRLSLYAEYGSLPSL